MRKMIALSLLVLPILFGCSQSEPLNDWIDTETLRMVNEDLSHRATRIGFQHSAFTLQTIGQPIGGTNAGNAVSIGLVPTSGGSEILLPLEYYYSFALRKGGSQAMVSITQSPTDADLQSAIDRALRGR